MSLAVDSPVSSPQDAHKNIDGVPNLLKVSFDDINQCPTCIEANLRKNSAGKRSLSEILLCPYKGLFVEYAFAGALTRDKEGKIIKSSRLDVKSVSGESGPKFSFWMLKRKCFMTIPEQIKHRRSSTSNLL